MSRGALYFSKTSDTERLHLDPVNTLRSLLLQKLGLIVCVLPSPLIKNTSNACMCLES